MRYVLLFGILFITLSSPIKAGFLNVGNEGDLQFEEVVITKQKKNFVCVRYTIKNTGDAALNLLGPTNRKKDNLTIRAYLSGDKKYSKGDVLLDGGYIDNNAVPNGKLLPGKSFTGELKIDLHLKTNYLNVLILKLDDFKTVPESDEWNNTYPVIL